MIIIMKGTFMYLGLQDDPKKIQPPKDNRVIQ